MVQDIKRVYEGMFLVDSAAATSNWDDVMNQIQTILGRAEAEVINIRKWDDRRLCYEIRGCKRGVYILCYFKARPAVIGQIERDVQINESILRVMVLRADHMTEEDYNAPTPLMLQETRGPSMEGESRETEGGPASDIEEVPFDALEDVADDMPRRRRD